MKTATIATLLIALFTLPAMAGLAGGWSAVDVKNEDVISAANFAVKEKTTKENQLALKEIKEAARQVVAGLNYRVELKVVDNSTGKPVERMATAVVYQNLDDEFSLTSWEWQADE